MEASSAYLQRSDARYFGHLRSQQPSSILFDLDVKQREVVNARADAFLSPDEDVKANARRLRSPLDDLNEMMKGCRIPISISIAPSGEFQAVRQDGAQYTIEQMSDGERSMLIICAHVLTAASGAVVLIDEPERHLHQAVAVPLLRQLLEKRSDCAFMVSTHDLALPTESIGSRVLIVRACKWHGADAQAWDIDEIACAQVVPEDLRLAILGSRRQITFVEGTSSSVDRMLYEILLPHSTIVPVGSCSEVMRAVRGLRLTAPYHNSVAYGVIDEDDRGEDVRKQLASEGVYTIRACAVESMFYCGTVLRYMVCAKAAELGREADELLIDIQTSLLDYLRAAGQVCEHLCSKRATRIMRNCAIDQLPSREVIKDADNDEIVIRLPTGYKEELQIYENLLAEEDLDIFVRRYPIRESNFRRIVASGLEYRRPEAYEEAVRNALRSDCALRAEVQEFLRPVVEAQDKQAHLHRGRTLAELER